MTLASTSTPAWVWGVVGVGVGIAFVAVFARIAIRRALIRQAQAERRARTAERQAEIASMTRGLAHEIKNPLSTIALNAQLLGEGIAEAPVNAPLAGEERQRLQRRADALRREVDRLRGILTDFLNFAGELRLEIGAHDAGQVVRELGDFFAPQALDAGVRMRVDVQPGAQRAMIDPAHLKQALLNLLLNAVHALEGVTGGNKDLTLRVVRLEDAAPRGRAGGGRVRIEVVDTGPGMSPEVAARVFDPYFTTRAGGSGLGLPTTRRIIEAMGGIIEIETAPGAGTCVRVEVLSVP